MSILNNANSNPLVLNGNNSLLYKDKELVWKYQNKSSDITITKKSDYWWNGSNVSCSVYTYGNMVYVNFYGETKVALSKLTQIASGFPKPSQPVYAIGTTWNSHNITETSRSIAYINTNGILYTDFDMRYQQRLNISFVYMIDTFKVSYIVQPDDTYGYPPATTTYGEVYVPANETFTLPDKPTTNWTTSNGELSGVPGYWIFEGWRAGSAAGKIVTTYKVTNNITFYAKWTFVPSENAGNITYTIVGDTKYGIPGDTPSTLTDSNLYINGASVTLKDVPTTSWTRSNGTSGDPVTWKFSGWVREDTGTVVGTTTYFTAPELKIKGTWTATPRTISKYTVSYESNLVKFQTNVSADHELSFKGFPWVGTSSAIEPSSQTVEEGETFTVKGASNLGGSESAYIKYDYLYQPSVRPNYKTNSSHPYIWRFNWYSWTMDLKTRLSGVGVWYSPDCQVKRVSTGEMTSYLYVGEQYYMPNQNLRLQCNIECWTQGTDYLDNR